MDFIENFEEIYLGLLEQFYRRHRPRNETKECRVEVLKLLRVIKKHQFDDVEQIGHRATIQLQEVEIIINHLTTLLQRLTIFTSESGSFSQAMAAKEFAKPGSLIFDFFMDVTPRMEFVSEYQIPTYKGLVADWKKSQTNADLQLKLLNKLLKKTSNVFKPKWWLKIFHVT